MSLVRALPASTALSLCLASAAWADLTAAEVWGDWRDYMRGLGYQVSATETMEGATLDVRDITVDIAGGPDIEKMTLRIGGLKFVEDSNGSVEVVMPDTLPLALDIAPKGRGKPASFAMTYTQSGQKMIASGTPEEMAYDYSADTYALTLTEMTVDGTTFDKSAAKFALTGKDFISRTSVTVGEKRRYDQSTAMGETTYEMFFRAPEGAESIDVKTTAQSIEAAGTSTVPAEKITDANNMNALLGAGFQFDGTLTTTGTESYFDIVSPEGQSKIKSGAAKSSVAVALDTSGARYDVSATGVQLGAQLAGVPFPLFFEMAQTGFKLEAPVVQDEAPQDFALGLNLTGFTMSDVVWSLFDPSGQLPRDPATVALDLNGKAKLLVDFLDPEATGKIATTGAAPAEVHMLNMNNLTLDAVGAKLEATGDMTFDNTDKTTLPGFPKPVGSIDISLAGANGLIDKLTAMGFLPSEQATGARMMMGLFGVPGAAPDTLTSKIEFNEAGQILANGQRIK